MLGIATSDAADLEQLLHRTADQGPDRPMAVTFRPTGPDLDARAEHAHEVIAHTRALSTSLPLQRITLTDVDATAHALTA